jgi:hypothetical protein
MEFCRILLPTECQKLLLINIASCPRRNGSSSKNFPNSMQYLFQIAVPPYIPLPKLWQPPTVTLQNRITAIYRKPRPGTHIVLFHYTQVFQLQSTEICLCSSPSYAGLHAATERAILPWRGVSGNRRVVCCTTAGTGVV